MNKSAHSNSDTTRLAGYDCSGGKNMACNPGNYSNGDTEASNPDSPCRPCEKGYSCPGGTDHSTCRQGSYQNATSQNKCLSCPAGKYQLYPGQDACVDCPAGYFCPERTVNPIVCGSVALYCPLNSGIVQAVREGYYITPPAGRKVNDISRQFVRRAPSALAG